jgi:hypothetical protein
MNDPRYPFHAISYHDAFGEPPYISGLPKEEDDFSSLSKALAWLKERGGGTVQHCNSKGWKLVASVLPEGDGAAYVA